MSNPYEKPLDYFKFILRLYERESCFFKIPRDKILFLLLLWEGIPWFSSFHERPLFMKFQKRPSHLFRFYEKPSCYFEDSMRSQRVFKLSWSSIATFLKLLEVTFSFIEFSWMGLLLSQASGKVSMKDILLLL